MNRREFLKAGTALGLGFAAPSLLGKSVINTDTGAEKMLPKRELGRTGRKISVVGLGGVVLDGMPQQEANRLVDEMLELGLNYFDVAPSYGNAEIVMGNALKGKRDKIFLACKTLERDQAGSEKELHNSLKRLHTDHLDLYQFHAISSMDDVEKIFGPKGAAETFVKAKKEGKIRHIGFSAHSVKAALAALDRFDFDTVLFPVNFVLFFRENFGPQVIQKAREKGVAVLAIKALALSRVPKGQQRPVKKCWYVPVQDPNLAGRALRFTLSRGATAAVPPGDPTLFRMAVELALALTPVTAEDENMLRQAAKGQEPIFKLDV